VQALRGEPDPAELKTQLGLARARIRKLEEQLEETRHRDSLTGLPNRVRLLDRTEQAIVLASRRDGATALLLIEVDRFKSLHQSLDFQESDELWLQFAQRLGSPLRLGDTLARLDNDQYAILLPEVQDSLEPCRLAQHIQDSLGTPFRVGARELRVTASVGISLYPQDGEEAITLLKQAEVAANRARSEGGNTFQCSTPTLNEASMERREMELYLGDALLKNELEVVFQPQCDREGNILSLEALVRWQHPVLGFVPPSKFIPLAEENQLIHPIGEWVLKTACRRVVSWQALCPHPLRLAVNVSPLQIAHPQWVDTVARTLRETRFPARRLEVEITEGTLLRNAKPSNTAIHLIKAMGIRIGIDDFGTGYSSLNYLHRLPIDTLKIDLSFVSGLHPEHPDLSSVPIVQSILDLGQNLHLDVVAEGVETSLQLETLSRMGCRIFQGYYLGTPMDAGEIEARLEAQQIRAFNSLLATGTQEPVPRLVGQKIQPFGFRS
jgi:diguanylate cyclase (GGDEF)-like protein